MESRPRGLPLILPVLMTHLAVAVLGAVSVGSLAYLVQRRALLDVTHDLEGAVVNQLREALERRAEDQQAALAAAESILSDAAVDAETRKQRVRDLIAEGRLPHLAVRSAEGALDSLFWAGSERPTLPSTLPSALLSEARRDGSAWAPTPGGILGVRVWKVGEEDVGLLSSRLEAEDLTEEAERFRARFLGAEGRVEITSASGDPLAAAGPEAPLLADRVGRGAAPPGEEIAAADEHQAGGRWWLRAFAFVPHLGCWIGAAQPRSVALAPVYALRGQVALLAGLVALLASVVGLLLSRSVTQPVTELAVRMRMSAEGGFRSRVPERGALELKALSRGFNDAVELLAHRQTELQTETRMRLRISRYVSAQDLQEVFSQAADHDRTLGARSQLYVDLVPRDEAEVAAAAPDRLVLFLGELFSLAAEVIERHGGRLDEHIGDTVLGTFVGPSRTTTARSAFAAAQELVLEAQSLSARWTETLSVQAPISAGVVTVRPGQGEDPADKAGLLQRTAPPYAVWVDGATAAELDPTETLTIAEGSEIPSDTRQWQAHPASAEA